MAYTNFTPSFRVEEADNAASFRVWDKSTWNGESDSTTVCILRLYHHASDGTITQYDDYLLIDGADKTKFNEYLDQDGHVVNISDIYLSGAAIGDRFEDGYYVIYIEYDEGSYGAGSRPYYEDPEGFLAKSICAGKRLALHLIYPETPAAIQVNNDVHTFRGYLDAAKYAVDNSMKTEFARIVDLLNDILDEYEIDQCY